MVLMDMPVIDPLVRAGRRLLAPGGRFVFAVQHPAFNSNAVRLCAETETRVDGDEVTRHAVKVSDYLVVPAGKGPGMPGEPEPHWYFHRPLHELFGAFFQAGFVLDALEEPALGHKRESDELSWSNLPGIPPVLVARFVPHPVSVTEPESSDARGETSSLRSVASTEQTGLSHRDDSRYSCAA